MPEDKLGDQIQPSSVATADSLTHATQVAKPQATSSHNSPIVKEGATPPRKLMTYEETTAIFHQHTAHCGAGLPRETRKLGAEDIKAILAGYGISSYKTRVSTFVSIITDLMINDWRDCRTKYCRMNFSVTDIHQQSTIVTEFSFPPRPTSLRSMIPYQVKEYLFIVD